MLIRTIVAGGLLAVHLSGCQEARAFNPAQVSAFFEAVNTNDLDRLRELLTQEPELVHARNDFGYTGLVRAAAYGEPDTVKFLLNRGSDVNAQADLGQTAIYQTIDNDKVENARLLLTRGASPHLEESSQQWTPLPKATYYGRLEITRLLLGHGADPNRTGKYGQTALHWSMRAISTQDQLEILDLLVEAGVDINRRDKQGRTALQMAERRNFEPAVEFLKKHGAR